LYGFIIRKVKHDKKHWFEVIKLRSLEKKDDLEMMRGISTEAADTLEILTHFRHIKHLV
jgi:hypothetical protein